MRVRGSVTVNGVRASLDWTVMGDGSISEGPGLSAENVTMEWNEALVREEEVVLPEDGYEDLTVTELKNRLSQRGQPIYGNKEQLINRLRGWDSSNPEGLIEEETDAIGEAEVTSEVVEEAPEAEPVPIDEGDESDGIEGE